MEKRREKAPFLPGAQAGTPFAAWPLAMTQPRILIVDDEQAILFALSRYLQKRGYRTWCAREEEEAAALILHEDFDLLIADLRLTGVQGAEGLEVIKLARHKAPTLPVILLTAFGTAPVMAEARNMGVNLLLAKPQPLDFLADQIHSMLEGGARA